MKNNKINNFKKKCIVASQVASQYRSTWSDVREEMNGRGVVGRTRRAKTVPRSSKKAHSHQIFFC